MEIPAARTPERIGGSVTHQSGIADLRGGESYIGKLAQFFPQAAPVRIPVQVVAPRPGGRSISECAVIEFGTPSEALFTSTLPLEFDDHIRLQELNGDLVAEAAVVAVQYHDGRKAVAVRFLSSPRRWMGKS